MMRGKSPSGAQRSKLRYSKSQRGERIDIRLDPSGRRSRRGAGAGLLLALIVLSCFAAGLYGLFGQLQVEFLITATPVPSPVVTVQVVGLTAMVFSTVTDSTPPPTATDLSGVVDAIIELPTPRPAQVSIKPDTEYVNVRAGPGLEHTMISRLVSGQSAPVTGKSEDGQWWQIQLEDRRGWVFAALVTFSGDPAAVAIADAQ